MAGEGGVAPDIYGDPSNVLVVVGLGPEFFLHAFQWRLMRDHFSVFGKVVDCAQYPKLGRAVIVYTTADEATRSKEILNSKRYGDRRPIKIFYGKAREVELVDVDPQALQPPARTKQFLISPPMSPCAGWEQIREDPPVSNEALSAALSKLTMGDRFQVVEGDRVVGSHVLPSIFVDPGDTATDEEYTPRVPSITLERFHTATARPPSLTRA